MRKFDDADFIRRGDWDTCCMKQRGDPHYKAFGLITSPQEPITVYLRSANPADDFKQTIKYPTIDAMLADQWMID